MLRLSSADDRVSPPTIDIPPEYNAAHDLLERNLRAGRGSKIAYFDDYGSHTYEDLAERVNRCANARVPRSTSRAANPAVFAGYIRLSNNFPWQL